ncbi:MAG: tetratricopeptide repeat protein [Planctomycetota bacterium]|nr:MAG: tetratricopeptide repeat protein [Planctomycetota bacterium]
MNQLPDRHLIAPSRFLFVLGAALLLSVGLAASGCDNPAERSQRGPASDAGARGGLFDTVAENINQLEQYETGQILKQVCDRLNQWYQQEQPEIAWQRDPLLDTLSDELREQPAVEDLGVVRYQTPDDAWFLQQCVWMRDISTGARADQFEDLGIARRLFDWTVRNIRLEPDPVSGDTQTNRHRPFETLLFGRGTADERAWVFTLLARQQGLDVVMLAVADEDGGNARSWLPALVLDDELYLFDTRLGLAIPGREPDSVATLAQVAADPELLRNLDLENEPYPITADDLKHVVAYVEGSPASLSKRMALVEAALVGPYRMKLMSPGSTLAARVEALPHVAEVKLWPLPFEVFKWKSELTPQTAQRAGEELVVYQAVPPLKVGRALQFKGQIDGQEGAKTQYLNARPPESLLENYQLPPDLAERIPPRRWAEVEAAQILWMREAKQNASYWLGLIFFEQEDYPNAIDFLDKRTLQSEGKNPWRDAARYNLARTYEAQGKLDKAIELYEADGDSPQSHGNRLRARRLREQMEAAAGETEVSDPEKAADDEASAPEDKDAEAGDEDPADSPEADNDANDDADPAK